LPVILFGDHTAAFKFINRPFARGADGTKLYRPRTEHLDAKFAWHFLQTVQLPQSGYDRKTKYLENVEIPLPPLEERRRIAAILDKCNDIQVSDRKRCETLERFQASYFRHLFGEPSIFNESWPPRALVSCSATIQTGPFGSLLHQSDYIRCGIPILNPKHIVNGVIICGENETIANDKAAELSGYQLKEGDVLLARRGEMGRCAVVTSKEDGWLCGTGSMFIRPLRDMLAPEYLCALLSSPYMRSRLEKIAIGTTLLNLNAKIVGDLSIPVPPIDLQRRYTDVLARLSKMGEMTSRSAHARSAAVASVQNKLLTAAGS
jgi:type I restriction enzyme S subunit